MDAHFHYDYIICVFIITNIIYYHNYDEEI